MSDENQDKEERDEMQPTETTGDIGGSTMRMEVTNFALPPEKPAAKDKNDGKAGKAKVFGLSLDDILKNPGPRWDLLMPALQHCGIIHKRTEYSVCHFTIAVPHYASAVWGWEEEDDLAMTVGIFSSSLETVSNAPQSGRVFHIVCSLLSHSRKNTELFDNMGLAVVMADHMKDGYELTSRLNAHGGTGNMVLEDLHKGFQGGLIKFKQTVTLTEDAAENAMTVSAALERASDMLLASVPYYKLLGQETPETISQMHADNKLRKPLSGPEAAMLPDGARCIGSLSGDEFKKLLGGDPEMLKKHGTLLAMLGGLMGGKMDLAKLLEELRKRREAGGESGFEQNEDEDE